MTYDVVIKMKNGEIINFYHKSEAENSKAAIEEIKEICNRNIWYTVRRVAENPSTDRYVTFKGSEVSNFMLSTEKNKSSIETACDNASLDY